MKTKRLNIRLEQELYDKLKEMGNMSTIIRDLVAQNILVGNKNNLGEILTGITDIQTRLDVLENKIDSATSARY